METNTIKVGLLIAALSTVSTEINIISCSANMNAEVTTSSQSIQCSSNNSYSIIPQSIDSSSKKKNYRDLYGRIAKSNWYQKAYNGKSVGEVIRIEE